jgi:hypothetical protein
VDRLLAPLTEAYLPFALHASRRPSEILDEALPSNLKNLRAKTSGVSATRLHDRVLGRRSRSQASGPPGRAQAASRTQRAAPAAEHDAWGPEPRAAQRARRGAQIVHEMGAAQPAKPASKKVRATALKALKDLVQ